MTELTAPNNCPTSIFICMNENYHLENWSDQLAKHFSKSYDHLKMSNIPNSLTPAHTNTQSRICPNTHHFRSLMPMMLLPWLFRPPVQELFKIIFLQIVTFIVFTVIFSCCLGNGFLLDMQIFHFLPSPTENRFFVAENNAVDIHHKKKKCTSYPPAKLDEDFVLETNTSLHPSLKFTDFGGN